MSNNAHEMYQPRIQRAIESRAIFRWLALSNFKKVVVSAAGLALDFGDRSEELSFARVVKVDLHTIPYVGGWFKLTLHDGRSYSFNMGLERSDYILDALVNAQPALVNALAMERFRRYSIIFDHSMARLQRTWSDRTRIAIDQIVVPTVLTLAVLWTFAVRDLDSALVVFALIGLVNGVASLGLWSLAEIFFVVRKNSELIENPLNPVRDMARELRAQRLGRAARVVIMGAALLGLSWWL